MIGDEPLLEPLARLFRFREGIPYVAKHKPVVIVDLGCGHKAPFYSFIKQYSVKIKKYIGIDPLLSKKTIQLHSKNNKKWLIKKSLEKKIPLPSSMADYVVSFATFEHFDYPKEILNDAIRILKKGGKLILTTPTPRSKPILEFLEKIGLLSSREIHEHKHYFDKNSLRKIIVSKNVKVSHRYFEMGLNNLLIISRNQNKK